MVTYFTAIHCDFKQHFRTELHVTGQITEGFEIAMEISEVSTARQPRTRSSLHRAHIYCAVCSAQTVHRPCTYTMCTHQHTHATQLRGAYDGRQPEHADYDEVDHDLRTLMRVSSFAGSVAATGRIACEKAETGPGNMFGAEMHASIPLLHPLVFK